MPDNPDEIKIGARNSRHDQERLQNIHDFAVENGALCAKPKALEEFELPDDALVYQGNEVKALGDGKVAGYLVRFSTENDPDLTGDYFTPETDFGESESCPVYYHHGLDSTIGKKRIGKANLRRDSVGVWAEAQLQMRDDYEKMIYKLAEDGKLGWSSGTAPHLVEREASGKSNRITLWPLGLDASLTPTPAEYRNSVIPLKSLTKREAMEKAANAPELQAYYREIANREYPVHPEPTGTAEAIGEIAPSEGEAKAVNLTPPIQPNEVNRMEITPEIQTIIDASLDKALKAFADKLPTNGKGGVVVTKDEGDQPWESLGQFYKAVAMAGSQKNIDPRLYAVKVPTGLGELIPADGGFLVPPQYAPGLIENVYSLGSVLPLVSRDSIAGNRMIYNAVDETSRADGSRFGGIRGYWVAEASTITASRPSFRQVDLKLNKVAALVYASDELLADQNALQSYLGRSVPAELKFLVEDAIINGNGVGKPQGILQSASLFTLAPRENEDQINFSDIVGMWAHRIPYFKDYVWLCSPTAIPFISQLTLANATEAPLRFVDFGPDGVLRMMGRPVIEMEQCPLIGASVGDIILASPSQYQVIDKGGVEAASSIHVNFTADEQVFRFTYRIDGAPLWSDTLTPYGGSATDDLSPFVVLTTAST